jgi:hydroxyacylglutathione hydrolase
MKIHQIYTHNELRNFTYILELADQTAIVIDPWDAVEISHQLKSKELSLKAIINTHEHSDHIQGNAGLIQKYACEVWAHSNGKDKIPGLTRTLVADESIVLGEHNQLLVLDTPGHTFAHLCFIVKQNGVAKAVFTGDTLFNAGVGHCRGGGDEEVLYQTISQQFQTLADDIVIYPGHDYLENNLRFTLNFEPDNQIAKEWLGRVAAASYVPGSIQTTIGNEKSFNTFMRLDNPDILEHLSLENPEPKLVFLALRSLRDKW